MSTSPIRPFTGTAAPSLVATPAAADRFYTPFGEEDEEAQTEAEARPTAVPSGYNPFVSFYNGSGIVESVTVPEPVRPQARPLTRHVSPSPAQIQQNLAQRLGFAKDDNAVFVNPTLEELVNLISARTILATFKYIVLQDGQNGQLRLLSSLVNPQSFKHVNLFDNDRNVLVGAGYFKIGRTKEGAIAIAFDGKSLDFPTERDSVEAGQYQSAEKAGLVAVQAYLKGIFPEAEIILVGDIMAR